ncbi:MAG: M48 family metalloprotease [Deferrisomatales bacterium]|nr:M48 family metalloprotease [Deferrisomatales bacterium]
MWMTRALALAAALGALSLGCAGRELAGSSLLSKAEERTIGREVVAEIRRQYRILDDPYMDEYLKGIGERITRALGPTHFEMTFHVVADPRANAFAVPGGHIFVTSQTVLLCQDESELAGVIAHEIGHVEARHLAHRVQKSAKLNLAAMAAVLAGAFLSGSPEAGAAIASFGVAGAQTKMLQYSRADEEDADRRAARALVAAGYDPWGLVRFMDTIRRESPAPEGVPAYLFTHPLPENRSAYLSDALRQPPAPQTDARALGPLWRAQARVLAQDPRTWGPAAYRARVEENPGSADARLGLGVLLQRQGRYEEALEHLREAQRLDPADPEVLHEQARVRIRQGRPQEGVAQLEALRVQGDAPTPALRDLGWAYLEKDQGEAALGVYDELARRDPGWGRVQYYRGMALGRAGREGEAHAALGDYHREEGRGSLARRHYEEAIRRLPEGDERRRVQEVLQELRDGRRRE